jgi:hypothetical protein
MCNTEHQVSMIVLKYVLLGASDQDDDLLEVVEEEDVNFTAVDSKKRKTDGETQGGVSKKLRTEDIILVV